MYVEISSWKWNFISITNHFHYFSSEYYIKHEYIHIEEGMLVCTKCMASDEDVRPSHPLAINRFAWHPSSRRPPLLSARQLFMWNNMPLIVLWTHTRVADNFVQINMFLRPTIAPHVLMERDKNHHKWNTYNQYECIIYLLSVHSVNQMQSMTTTQRRHTRWLYYYIDKGLLHINYSRYFN